MMKIHEIIREKRLERGLTQEQVANHLGVSPPAVNKWEKGVTCPDITLLPPLARLLGTDLNTLLSFQEDLTPQEVGQVLNELCDLAGEQGIQAAVQLAREKLREFPNCDLLALNTALTMEGLASIHGSSGFDETIEALYLRTADSKDPAISHQAKAILVRKYIEGQDLGKAQQVLDQLPGGAFYDKTLLQASLCMAQKNWEEAALLTERKLVHDLTSVQTSLYTLMDLAAKEGDLPRAKDMAAAIKELVRTFDLWDYSAHMADFQLAALTKDPEEGVRALEHLLASMEETWDLGDSPFYCHIPRKENSEWLGRLVRPKFLQELSDPHPDYDFLHQSPALDGLLARYRSQI